MYHYIPVSAIGITCQKCDVLPACHKVEEVKPNEAGHPFTIYLCCNCFAELMGETAKKVCERG